MLRLSVLLASLLSSAHHNSAKEVCDTFAKDMTNPKVSYKCETVFRSVVLEKKGKGDMLYMGLVKGSDGSEAVLMMARNDDGELAPMDVFVDMEKM